MRIAALIAALALASCGQQQAEGPPAETAGAPVTTGGADLSGHLIVVGEDFRLESAPGIGVVLNFPDYDQTVSGPYVMPHSTDTGALLESGGISMTLTPQACTHNGATYPMRASITLPNARPAEGCALIRWDRHLIELIPQIDACIAQSPETRWVSYAGRTGAHEVTVRLLGNNTFVECTVTNGNASAAQLPENKPPLAGDSEALFVRGSGGPNPGGECTEAPEVRGPNGEMLGWMMDPLGC